MATNDTLCSPSEAARRLGVSTKALRLYEARGLISPQRSGAGWRFYSPDDISAASEIIALRALGFSLRQIARVRSGDGTELTKALATHEERLGERIADLQAAAAKVRSLRSEVTVGAAGVLQGLSALVERETTPVTSFKLPWPWGGELFHVRPPKAINFIVGPLASGKTRLAMCLADALPDAGFVGLDRKVAEDRTDAAADVLRKEPEFAAQVERAMSWLRDDGAEVATALTSLLTVIERDTPEILVFDLIENDLSEPTQQALIAYLKRRGPHARPLYLMTRSSVILDLDTVGPDEAIIFCPPNHNPPFYVAPYEGAPGYEAVGTCLATPAVRERSSGVVAILQERAG